MSKTDISKYNNNWYAPGGSSISRILWYFINAVFIKNSCIPFVKFKIWLLRRFGAKIGKGVMLKPCVNIKYPWNLEIGDYTWIGENVWIDNLAKVTIGSNCCLSQGAMILCGNHNYKKTTFDLIVKDVTLEDGVWIGAQCTVCPGVTAHSHSMLCVGSVATKDMSEYGIYQGNPATRIKHREIKE